MQAGFHSASAIALARVSDFSEVTGLKESEARSYHAAALDGANAAASQWIKLYDVARDKSTTPIRMIPSPADFFMPLKGFAELINDQPWCECEHCQSVLSPAAYFVDLMYYIEQNILKDSFKNGREKHPLHLQVRRPDLWELELTCKNTNDYVPYLDVVNEVLERYLRETISRPVGTTLNIYKHLAEQDGSFKQPFTLPIERLEILLGHFSLTRYDVAKAMGSDRAIQVRARLKISQKEYDLITTERTSTSTADLDFLKQLFKTDVPNNTASVNTVLAPMEMEMFLHATGLAHEIVEAVLKTKFVNVDGSSNPEIEVVLGKLKETDVQNNSELVKHITLRRLDRIHRFARLWRKLPWTVEELDYVLTRLASQNLANGIDISAIEKIVDLLDRNAAWSLPIDELMALSDVFPPKGLREPTSLFDRLFNQPPFLARDGRWLTHVVQGVPPTSIRFSHPAWKKKENPVGAPGISDPNNNTLTRLLAGLQVADKELVALIESLSAIPDIDYQSATSTRDESILLTKESIGILYHHARLMRLLKSPVTDFVKLIKLTPRIKVRLPAEQYIRDLGDVTSVVEFVAWQRASGFSPDEIIYVTGGASPEGALDPATLASEIVARVKTEKSLEFADTVFTQIGLTDLQSRKIVLDNTSTTPLDNKAFEILSDGVSYRIKAGFDLGTTPLSIDPSIRPSIDVTLIRDLLNKYHAVHILHVALGSALNSSPEEIKELRFIASPSPIIFMDTLHIPRETQGLQGILHLQQVVTDTLRYRALFKSKVFDVKSLSFVRNNSAVFFPAIGSISTQVVRNVAAYVAYATIADTTLTTASNPSYIDTLHEVLKDVSFATDKSLAEVLRTDKTRIGALKPHLIPLPNNPFDAIELLARCLVFTEQLGVSGETLKLMKSDAFNDLSRAAEDVYGAFRAKYPEEKTFQEKMEPFVDKLRTRKRDGLVDFIVSKWPEPFTDANKLYEYFLIDVLMEGCGRTSRVVSAISSLQLYVHRVLMNLEKSTDMVLIGNGVVQGVIARFSNPDKRAEWYWREHYRVWEANRKVFLYPENYLEPELRDDKTPLFREFEDSLLQREVNDSSVHDAYAKYLIGFDEAAHLKIGGTYYDSSSDLLHLFGVTQDAPPVYHYRTIGKTMSDTPRISAWQKLSLQIPVGKISPIIFEERLYIFWLETTTRPITKFVKGDSEFEGYRHNVRIKYATLRLDGTWTLPQSLRFLNEGAVEDSRAVYDPKNTNPSAVARAARIKELEEKIIPDLTTAAGTAGIKAKDAADFADVASKKAVAMTRLANNPGLWVSEPPESTVTLGDVTLWIMENKFLLVGWDQFMKNWLRQNPGWVAAMLVGFPPHLVTAMMARDAAIVIDDGARVAAGQAEVDKQRAEGKVKNAEAELATLKGTAAPKVSVRWDKSGRDHTEPLDNYKPEGWAWDRVYPNVYSPPNTSEEKTIRLVLAPGKYSLLQNPSGEVDWTSGILRQIPPANDGAASVPILVNDSGQIFETASGFGSSWQSFYAAALILNSPDYLGQLEKLVAQAPATSDVQVVNGDISSAIIESNNGAVWMKKHLSVYLGKRLGTTLTTTLRKAFSHKGAVSLLQADFQNSLEELSLKISPVAGQSDPVLRNPFHAANPFLAYYRETFFQIPFLVANHLNSQQKFAETQRWYHAIFNPTADDDQAWRYREFRELHKATDTLRALLTNEDSLAAYREDPFNPHAIARTRLSAYQKSIVMKYIDNLLDWGDSLFGQFTMESINEATMLYVMAQDILGPRPATLGSCGEGEVSPRTYAMIRPGLNQVSDFLIELEVPLSPSANGPRKLVTEAGRRVFSFKQNRQEARIKSSLSKPSAAPSLRMKMESGLSVGQPVLAGDGFNPTGGYNQTGAYNQTGGQFQVAAQYQAGGKYWTNVGGTSLANLYNTGSGAGNGGLNILGTDSGTPPINWNRSGNIDFINPNNGVGGGKFGVREGGAIEAFDQIPPLDIKYGRRDYFEIEHPVDAVIPTRELTPPKVNPVELVPPKQAVFCIPPNKDLLAYWARVEDRLFKVRNCMDIAGVRRRLELFAPEIDPRLLVRMKAAGLSLDDVLNSTSGNLPPYRFTYLIDKAKQHAGTLQSFGSQLLSAIEKRDGEELAQLRAVHEQNLLKMRSRMVQLEIDAAEDAIEGLRRQKTAAEYRQNYFRSLSDVGLLASESKQQQLQREASNFRTAASLAQFVAGILSIIPDAGAPTAMKFGGSQLGAAGRSAAEGLNALAAFNEMGASMAGMESSNRRRDQDWKHQAELAKRDISQIDKQITAAEIKRDIAVRSLEVHDKTVDQSEELFDFFGTKFSSFGRYTLLSTRLHKLYRQAFNSALSMAKMTEQAYRAERTDDDTLLDGKYWDADNAGLLAGERLLIDLQGLEQRYIEKNYRQLEVEQSFSLAQFAPDKLATLRLTGDCTFDIAEWFFDLTYPGQYRRRLKAARLTIPCVTGPYSNVGATLRLESSKIRLKLPTPLTPLTALPDTKSVPLRHTVVMASSKAQYDAGVFDFSFRDERYMPFEGTGAISTWQLSLPKTLRVFDYSTISDVIVHLSYTADFSQPLKENREKEAEGVISELKKSESMTRSFSFRHEFPDAFHRLSTSPQGTDVDFTIEPRHFPFFLAGRTLRTDVANLRVLSPLDNFVGATLMVREKVLASPALEVRVSTTGPGSATPTHKVIGQDMKEFDLGSVLKKDPFSGITSGLADNYVIQLTAFGPMGPAPSSPGAIDPKNLHDIILEIKYSLA